MFQPLFIYNLNDKFLFSYFNNQEISVFIYFIRKQYIYLLKRLKHFFLLI